MSCSLSPQVRNIELHAVRLILTTYFCVCLISPLLLYTPFEYKELGPEHLPVSASCKLWWSQTFFPIAPKYFGSVNDREKNICYEMKQRYTIFLPMERGCNEPKWTSKLVLKPLMKSVKVLHCACQTGLTSFALAFSVVFDIKPERHDDISKFTNPQLL